MGKAKDRTSGFPVIFQARELLEAKIKRLPTRQTLSILSDTPGFCLTVPTNAKCPDIEFRSMDKQLTVSQIVEPRGLLRIGRQWNRLCEETPNYNLSHTGRWDLSLPWMLGWLSELPESHRDLLVLTASTGSTLRGILPLVMQSTPHGRELRLIGSVGCFADAKGILAAEQDQATTGEAFGNYLATEWIGQIPSLHLRSVAKQDPGLDRFVQALVSHSGWNAQTRPEPPQRMVLRPIQGPDGEPIWPLSCRRAMALVKKSFESGMFKVSEVSEESGRTELAKHAMMIRGMVRNDGPELKEPFGSIPMSQRILDYRFSRGVSRNLSQIGRLGSCVIECKGTIIAGALFADFGLSRYVIWSEVRVQLGQEPLVAWMLLSQLLRTALKSGLRELQVGLALGHYASAMKNMSPSLWSISVGPPRAETQGNSADALETANIASDG